MIKNYLKIAFRNLLRNKLSTTLNVAGLTFGLSCFFLLGLYVIDELTYDSFHANSDRIFRVIKHRETADEAVQIAGASYKLSEEAKVSIGEIENTARITQSGRDVLENTENQKKVNEEITAANNGLMEIFDFEAIDGNARTALVKPNSIVIVEELAVQLFGSTNVAGKTLKWQGLEQPFTITAVIKNHPPNSSFSFRSVYSESTYFTDSSYVSEVNSDWGSHDYIVYALLRKDANLSAVSKKLQQLVYANFEPPVGLSLAYTLQPLKDVHLYSENIIDRARSSNSHGQGSSLLLYLKMFALVGFFVLIIACINYMNLTTAKASNRAKEIGIKRVVGALRSHLISQFLVESMVITFISFVLAILLVNLMIPFFNEFVNKQLSLDVSTDYRVWLIAFSIVILTGLLSGSYPALLLSSFVPITLLKNLKIQPKSDFSLRKGLVVFQFSVSVFMIVATIVMYLQVKFMNNKDLGFNKDLLVVVDINSGKIRRAASTIVEEFSKIPNVQSVSTTTRVPGEWKTIPSVKIRQIGSPDEQKVAYFLGVDENFIKTFEVQLLQGKNFSSLNDSSSVILNETAAKMLNITEPSEQIIEIPAAAYGMSFNPLRNNQVFKARVIGIVKDFNFQTLREKIAPLVLAYQKNPISSIDYYTARIGAKDATLTIKTMEDILAKIDVEEPFEYHYLDQQLALFYAEDARRETMLVWVALATIFIACLGLFGLATYSAELRMKEIGVRKILGASTFSVISLLSKDFLKLVLIAIALTIPIAYWAMNRWLLEFAYHIEVKWWIFAIAGISATLIALITVSWQSIKAAVANPVTSLRSE
jgi:putative ABC transport system permease protein